MPKTEPYRLHNQTLSRVLEAPPHLDRQHVRRDKGKRQDIYYFLMYICIYYINIWPHLDHREVCGDEGVGCGQVQACRVARELPPSNPIVSERLRAVFGAVPRLCL